MEAKGKMASPVAQAGSLPCRRLVVGGAPICNRKLISSRARRTTRSPVVPVQVVEHQRRSCQIVLSRRAGEVTTKNSKLKMWMPCFVLFKSLARVNLTA